MHANTDALIRTRKDGHILHIELNRPAKLNGMTPEMAAQLAQAYTLLEAEDALWVGVLSAQGKHFTAGLDLPSWSEKMKRGGSMWPADCIDPFELRAPRRTKPMIAAVKGICFTAGIELMLACDVVIAADDCRFSQLEAKRGIMATGGATIRMAERAGMGNAMHLLLTGDEFDAATALRLNFVQQVVAAGTELAVATQVAERIVANAPLAVRAMRESVLTALERGPAAAVASFDTTQARLASCADAAEGVQSFIEKRAARFVGR